LLYDSVDVIEYEVMESHLRGQGFCRSQSWSASICIDIRLERVKKITWTIRRGNRFLAQNFKPWPFQFLDRVSVSEGVTGFDVG